MRLVICTTGRWFPKRRREHAIALSAAASGHEVVFVEAPLDVRALGARGSARAWLSAARPRLVQVAPRIHVLPQATLVPGHRSGLAQSIEAWRLQLALRTLPAIADAVVVATQPWQWPGVAAAPARRRVFDCTDDWRALIPRRMAAFDCLYRRIAREADAVILASDELAPAFPGGRAAVVGNGASPVLLRTPPTPPPPEPRMVYAGTISERFDAPLLEAVLQLIPDWSVELYGECRYAGSGSAPGAELKALLASHHGRVTWRGPVDRAELAGVLDRGQVLIAPHRAGLTRGQDSMKLYDYAARARPIVSTPGALGERAHVQPAGVIEAGTPARFASAVAGASSEAPEVSEARRRWAIDNRWESRWPRWALAALGAAP